MVVVAGPNGAGKTNLLEALHVGTQGFSPRTRSDAQLVRLGASAGRVRLEGVNDDRRFESDVVVSRHEARKAHLNGDPLRSAEGLRHELRALAFTPDRLALVKGGPGVRRAWVDRALARLVPARAPLPLDYAGAVGQRNAALRRLAAGASTEAALEPWTEQVASLGAQLVGARVGALGILAPRFAVRAAELGLEDADLAYEGDPPTAGELERRLERDVARGTTGLGPHLHDLRISAGGRDLRGFGSQGEQRTAVLALVLAEADALADRTGVLPLVLLDDVLSELDADHREALARILAGAGQAVLTTTSAAAFPATPTQSLVVSPGEVRAA